jgi:hypothetical protein
MFSESLWLVRKISVFLIATTLCGCGFLPGFGIFEDPVLYILPVGVVANQVACELQDFMNEQKTLNEKDIIVVNGKKTVRIDQLRRWRLSNDDADIKLTLNTDTSGYVNFTGVNVAQLGLESIASFITTQSKVSTLAAKVSGKTTRTVTVSFSVSPNPLPSSTQVIDNSNRVVQILDPVTNKPMSWNCQQNYRVDNPITKLFLRDWLTSYFETINTLDKNQPFPPPLTLTDTIARGIRQIAYPDAIPEQFKVQSVELSTQFFIGVDVSGGATPNLLGNGSVFIVPINGLSLDYNPDYSHKVDITLNMCDSWEQDSPCSGAFTPTNWTPLLDKQCEIYSRLAPLLAVKPPREYEGRGAHCSGSCICSKSKGIYVPKCDPRQMSPLAFQKCASAEGT